jgi:galactonate dehydratase
MDDATIDTVTCYVLKGPPGTDAPSPDGDTFPGTDYTLNDAGIVYPEQLEYLLVKIDLSNGVVGWGEVQAPVAASVPATIIESLAGPMLLGEDPRDVALLWDRLYASMNVRGHYQGFMVDAMAGLDIACWDAAGTCRDQSVASLLGGRRRDRLAAYVTGGSVDHLDRGFEGIKISVHHQDDLPLDDAMLAVEDPSRIKVEHHWHFETVHEALAVDRQLESLGVGFVEAPLPPENIAGYRELTRRLDVPVAMGESLRTRPSFRWRTERDGLAIGQPDINRTGITEGYRIAEHLDDAGLAIAPHVSASIGPGIAATWQLASVAPNQLVQEYHVGMAERSDSVLTDPLAVEDGTLVVPEGPGLGVTIDEEAVADAAVERVSISR